MAILVITAVFIIALGKRLRLPMRWSVTTAVMVVAVFALQPTHALAVLLGLFVMAPFLSRLRIFTCDQRVFPSVVLSLCVLSMWWPVPASTVLGVFGH